MLLVFIVAALIAVGGMGAYLILTAVPEGE